MSYFPDLNNKLIATDMKHHPSTYNSPTCDSILVPIKCQLPIWFAIKRLGVYNTESNSFLL